MQTVLFFLTAFILVSCSNCTNNCRFINVEGYQFEFPEDFIVEPGHHIDAAVGRIKGKSFTIYYGANYSIYPLVKSPEEFVSEGSWKIDAFMKFAKPSVSYDIDEAKRIKLIGVESVDSVVVKEFPNADIIAICELDSLKYKYGLVLPLETKQHIFKIDTINNHYRKVVIAKDPDKGETGLYLKNLKMCREDGNCYAISMNATKLTIDDQKLLLQIYSSWQIKH